MKCFRLCCGILAICGIIILAIVLMECFGVIDLFYLNGFGVDSNEKVYLGKSNGDICVYQDEKLVNTFLAPTSRGYCLTVENDTLILGTGGNSFLLNLDGTVISNTPDPRSSTISKLQFNRTCTSKNGKRYKLKHLLGRTKVAAVTENEDVIVYQMPLESYIFKNVMYLSALAAVLSIIYMFYSMLVQKKKT